MMSIVDDFSAIRAGLDQIENKKKPWGSWDFSICFNPDPDPFIKSFWPEVKWGMLRNKDDGSLFPIPPGAPTHYDPAIWEEV